jgi:NDP-sugar pyrophosphorylase family protein
MSITMLEHLPTIHDVKELTTPTNTSHLNTVVHGILVETDTPFITSIMEKCLWMGNFIIETGIYIFPTSELDDLCFVYVSHSFPSPSTPHVMI